MKVKFIRDYGYPVKFKAGEEYDVKEDKLETISDRFYTPLKVVEKTEEKEEATKDAEVKTKEVKTKEVKKKVNKG